MLIKDMVNLYGEVRLDGKYNYEDRCQKDGKSESITP